MGRGLEDNMNDLRYVCLRVRWSGLTNDCASTDHIVVGIRSRFDTR